MSGDVQVPAAVPRSWLAVLGLLTAVGPLSVDMYLPSFPAMADELGTSASALQLTLTAFMVGLALGQLVGPLSDHWGRRRLMLAGNALCVAASVACALAVSVEMLTACRFLQGLGGAAGVVLSRAVVADRAEGPAAARIFSLMMMINGTAPVLAPVIGGATSNLIGWRGVFWILSGLAIVMLAGAATVLTETLPPERRVRGGLGALLRDGRQVVFDRAYPGFVMTFGFGFATMFAFISASPFVMQHVLGLSPMANGIAVAANAIGLLAVNAVNARVVGRFGQLRLLSIGVTLLAFFSSLVLLVILADPVIELLLPALWCAVASLGLILANATSLALDRTRRAAGTGSALIGLMQYALAAVVAPLVGLGGDATAVPMAVAMTACALLAATALLWVRVRTAQPSGDCRR